ncbi:MAG: thermonuclease family protein [Desulfobacterales bacterium]|nr:thermonuclease family protein [Candidatus Omnitrophota bacterium]MBU4426334.1 thermonuclease family protein [Pseudomonadota bacterium]MCG2777916.1 thermonuclease family protein [Desulfobacterales bacterium]
MRNSLKIIPFLIAFVLALPFWAFAGQFKITRVCDGDTIKAEGHDIEITVRLVGIDAPETSKKKREPGQPYSQQAKKYLADLVLNKTVDIKGYDLEGYNRILGVISHDGKNINLEMVKVGLAEVYRGKPPRDLAMEPYLEAEKRAREAKTDMWSLGDKYISPKEWRKR